MALQVKKQEQLGPVLQDLTLKASQRYNQQIQNRPAPAPVQMNNKFAPPARPARPAPVRPTTPGMRFENDFFGGLGDAAGGALSSLYKDFTRDPVDFTKKAVIGTGQYFLSTPERVFRSAALEPLVGNTTAKKGQAISTASDPNTGIREVLFGREPVKSYQEMARDAEKAMESSDNASLKKLAPAAPFLAPAIAALDLTAVRAGLSGVKAGVDKARGVTPDVPPVPVKPAVSAPAAKASPIKLAGAPQVKQRVSAATGDPVEQMLYGQKMPAAGRELNFVERINPDRMIRENITQPFENKVNKAIYRASTSENPIVRSTARLAQGFSKEIGTPKELMEARRRFHGSSELGKIMGQDIAGLTKALPQESRTRIWSTLDPERATELGIKKTVLSQDERAIRDQLKNIIQPTTDGNLSRGLITAEQARNKNYIARRYNFFEMPEVDAQLEQVYKGMRTSLAKQFKGRKDIEGKLLDSTITDPAYLVGTKVAQSHAAWAHVDYANFLAKNGYVFDKPRQGLTQLPKNKLFGEAAGKYVAKNVYDDFMGFQYTNKALQAFNDLISAYDQLGIRQFKKQLLTIYNPAVRLGNQVTNRVVFSGLNGINPVRFNTMMQRTKKMIERRDPMYLEALEEGLMRTDITRADFTKNLAQYVDDPNILKQAGNWFQKSYSGADDRSKLAAYTVRRQQGYSKSEAAFLTQRGFQDYTTVGFFYDMAAKTPLIGNAFVRFAGDSMRILKNAAVDNPLTTIASVTTWGMLTHVMSLMSGEDAATRKTREERFGAPKIPFTSGLNQLTTGVDRDMSLNVMTPWGEINVGRFMPWNNLNEISGPGRYLPYSGNFSDPSAFQDPLLGQFAQLAIDRDFRNKSIQDPMNVVYDAKGVVKKFTEPTEEEKRNNVLRFLANNNIPLAREFDSVTNAAAGKPDMYGNTREPLQATLRAAGIKIEDYGVTRAEEQRKKDEFFDGDLARTKEFLKQNPDLEEAYFKFNNPTRDRKTNEKVSNLISPERWTLIRSDASGRLFNFLKSEAQIAAQKGKPIDPIFQLPTSEQERLVLDLRSRPTGEDIETEEILRATQPWYSQFEKAERDFYAKSQEFYAGLEKKPDAPKQNKRVSEYTSIKYPEQSQLVKDYYTLRAQSPDAAKNFFRANRTQLSADFTMYKSDRLDYINAKRKVEGFAPISESAFNNVTFGYEDDESKVARDLYFKGVTSGYGSSKSKSKKARAVFSQSVGGGRKRRASVKRIRDGKLRVTGKTTAKPKVSIKKSLV